MKSRGLDLKRNRIAVCLGPGGVGKTTISASLAVSSAWSGRAVDVMTVDPAPRLLDALGLANKDAEAHPVSLDGVAGGRAAKTAQGRLRALKLDPKRTFDAIVTRHAGSEATRTAILENRIYRNLSDALSGVADYMAMERLLELASDPATELIILDTPPAAEALNFLDAPRRLLDLLNSRAIGLLGAPKGVLRSNLRMVDFAARAVLSAFDRVTGLNLLKDVQSFVRVFDGMYEGFAARAKRSNDLLHADDTAIIVVTTLEPARIHQAGEFLEALAQKELKVRAIVVNRAMPPLPSETEIASLKVSPAIRRKLARNLADYTALKNREARSLETLSTMISSATEIFVSPELDHEPRSLSDLAKIGAALRSVR